MRLAANTPQGAFVELGVYQGGSAWRLAKLAVEQGRACHLFDTFTGVPECGPFDMIPIGHLGDVDLCAVKRLIPTAVFHVGVFPATMPADFREQIAFVHVDCDQYGACLAAIERFTPFLVGGGVMLFDDYNVTTGVQKAVNEAFPHVYITREGKAFVVK